MVDIDEAQAKKLVREFQEEQMAAADAGVDFNVTKYGNIDTNSRQSVSWDQKSINRYADVINEWGWDVNNGGRTSLEGVSASVGGQKVAYSPILQTSTGAVPLSRAACDNYLAELQTKLNAAHPNGWTANDLINLDAQGLPIGGTLIHGLIADVGNTADRTSQVMRFTGNNGSLSTIFRELAQLGAPAGLSPQDLLAKYGITTKALSGPYSSSARNENGRIIQPVVVNNIEFDALIDSDEQYNATVPKYPVESGYSVSDNVALDALTLSMTLYVTNTPVTWFQTHGNDTQRVQRITDSLKMLYFSKTPITVYTQDAIYESMIITSFDIKKSTDTGYSREIPITFTEVTITDSMTVDIPAEYGRAGVSEQTTGKAKTQIKSSSTPTKAHTRQSSKSSSKSSPKKAATQKKNKSQTSSKKTESSQGSALYKLYGHK